MGIPIEKVNENAQEAPNEETLPSHSRKIIHNIPAAYNSQCPNEIDSRAAKGPTNIRELMAHHHNTNR